MLAYSNRPRSRRNTLVVVVALLLVPVLAAINALVGPYATLPYLGLAALVVLVAMPLDLVVFGCFLLASVVAGALDYFAHVSQGFWLPYLLGGLFALRAIGERLRLGPRPAPAGALGTAHTASRGADLAAFAAALYLAVGLFSTLTALPALSQVIVASKNYLFMWGLLLVLLWGRWSSISASRMWILVVVVACLQLPVAMYQRLFVASHRGDAAAWDAVVGTLGGNPQTGGHVAAMALLCCVAVAVLLLRMRNAKLSRPLGWGLVLLCVGPIAVAEVKAGFIWLAAVFLFFFARSFVREPVRATVSLLLGAALLVGMGWIYKTTLYERSGRAQTLSQIYDQQIKYALDPREYRSDLRRLGRATAVAHWWQQHNLAEDPLRMLVGHGLGASRSISTFGIGEVAQRLGIPVDVTGASTLLWDVGLLGTVSFLMFLIGAASAAYRLSRSPDLSATWRETTFVSSVVLTMLVLGVFYNRDAIDHPAVQMLLFLSVSNVFLARRDLRAQQAGVRAVRPTPLQVKLGKAVAAH